MANDRWRDADAYAYQAELSLEGLAWEFLRRNPTFTSAYAEATEAGGAPDPAGLQSWGLSVAADPALTAQDQPIFWRPNVNPRTLQVVAAAPNAATALRFDPSHWPGRIDRAATADGLHLLLRIAGAEHRLWLPQPMPPGAPMALVQPLDHHLALRADAARRFAAQLTAASPKRVSRGLLRVAPPLLRRLVMTLRALDGRAAGASQRLMAEVLTRSTFDSPRAWEDSAARAHVARLLRGGAALVGGGYRDLLRRVGRP